MKSISFSTWSKRQLSELLDDRFNFRELAAAVQKSADARSQALLLLHAVSTSRAQRLIDYIWDNNLKAKYQAAANAIGNRPLDSLALRGTPMRALSPSYNAVLEEFAKAYSSGAQKSNAKRALWKETRQLQLQHGISNSALYTPLKLNPGNANAYLKHGAVEKVSLANAERLRAMANKLSKP